MTIEGIPIPYTPGADDTVALILLGCFWLSAYVLSRGRRFLAQLAKDFLMDRERTSLFAYSTSADMRYLLLLVLQTCVVGGVYVFVCLVQARPGLMEGNHLPSLAFIGTYTAVLLVLLALKWLLYSLLGWVFSGGARTGVWLESYSTLLYYLGFLVYPFALLGVYLDWGVTLLTVAGFFPLVFFKFMVFYKWKQLFCDKLYGLFSLILYFCALEIVPCFMLYQGLIQITDSFLINF